MVRRDGSVLAGGWLPDLVRLGELEPHIGDGVIEAIAAAASAAGRVPAPRRRRLMSVPLVIRLTVAMTLMPEAGYAEVACRVAGHLADTSGAVWLESLAKAHLHSGTAELRHSCTSLLR